MCQILHFQINVSAKKVFSLLVRARLSRICREEKQRLRLGIALPEAYKEKERSKRETPEESLRREKERNPITLISASCIHESKGQGVAKLSVDLTDKTKTAQLSHMTKLKNKSVNTPLGSCMIDTSGVDLGFGSGFGAVYP